MREHLAIVTWLPTELREGGQLPHSLQYTGISRFPSDGSGWPDGSYSIVCRFSVPPSEHGTSSEAHVRFLVDDAPHHRLTPGARFELYEGLLQVATVDVLW